MQQLARACKLIFLQLDNPVLNLEWRTVSEFPRYQVSNLGKVRNKETGKVLKTFIQNSGYEVASLAQEGKKSSAKRTVHRLVAQAFLPNPLDKPMVNHLDGNRLNNQATNLEWATPSENCQHAIQKGLVVYNRPTLGKKLKPRGKGKPTKFYGICWVEKSKYWMVRVQHNRQVVIQKAGFKEETQAAEYYDQQVKALGLDRPLNFPF